MCLCGDPVGALMFLASTSRLPKCCGVCHHSCVVRRGRVGPRPLRPAPETRTRIPDTCTRVSGKRQYSYATRTCCFPWDKYTCTCCTCPTHQYLGCTCTCALGVVGWAPQFTKIHTQTPKETPKFKKNSKGKVFVPVPVISVWAQQF